MTDREREAKLESITDLADKYLDAELARGEPFSEGLCNWAINKAQQEVGSISYDW